MSYVLAQIEVGSAQVNLINKVRTAFRLPVIRTDPIIGSGDAYVNDLASAYGHDLFRTLAGHVTPIDTCTKLPTVADCLTRSASPSEREKECWWLSGELNRPWGMYNPGVEAALHAKGLTESELRSFAAISSFIWVNRRNWLREFSPSPSVRDVRSYLLRNIDRCRSDFTTDGWDLESLRQILQTPSGTMRPSTQPGAANVPGLTRTAKSFQSQKALITTIPRWVPAVAAGGALLLVTVFLVRKLRS